MKVEERNLARVMRKKGYSINQIVKETGLTKSSVSVWVRDIALTFEQKKKLSEQGRSMESVEKRRASRLFNEHEKRQSVFDNAQKDYTSISKEELKLIGIILYLGEGGKTARGMARIANSDPAVIKIMMRFFREVCHVQEGKFRAHIHTFSHSDIEVSERYWSGVSKIPRQQFFKTYTKPSSASLQKRTKLPFGTLDVYVCDTKLFLTITGWMEKIKELVAGESVSRAL